MAVKLSVSLCWMLLHLFVHLVSASEDITVELGGEATLPCQAPSGDLILAVEWTRGDLESEYVFLYRDHHADLVNQHHSFMNRVELMDSEMKNGNLSVRLKNVTTDDSGTYECHVFQRRTNRRKRSSFNTKPVSTIRLDVKGPTAGDTEGGKDMHGHYGVILPVAGLIALSVLGAVGFVISKKSKGGFSDRPVDEAEVHQHLQEKENNESKTITHNLSDIQV